MKALLVVLALASTPGCGAGTPECSPVPDGEPAPDCEPAPAPELPATTSAEPKRVVATVGRTREFEVRDDRAWLGGQQVKLWGIRWGNALLSQAVTERHVRNLDNLVAHGINLVGVYVQGSNGGWPDSEAGLDGYSPDGTLSPQVADRADGHLPTRSRTAQRLRRPRARVRPRSH